MYFKNPLLALALAVATVEATTTQGFNYGATKQDGSPRAQADFKSQFSAAKNLKGASDFNSARLYTMIQGGTTNTPTEAIQAAIDEETSLLLGLWASGGGVDNEITALKSAIKQYGEKFTKLVVGISVGSEDLYRNSVTGARSPEAGPGVNPDVLVQHIKDVRSAIEGTGLSEAAVGHVDTWDAWTNGTNSEVIDNCDWLGFDGYPYYQNSMDNGIDNAKSLFDESVDKTKGVAKNKPVWITETGWPVSGPQENKATASVENAKKFWDQVGCSLFGNTNTWWYILEDAGASPSFGLTKSLNSDPLFDLSCPSDSTSSSSVANPSSTGRVNPTRGESASASASGSSGAEATGSGSGSGSAASATPTASGFASQAASGSASGKASSTPMASASATGSSSSGSGSGSSSSGSSGSASSNGGASSSSASASASSSPAINAADRPAGSIFGAVAAFLALAIAV